MPIHAEFCTNQTRRIQEKRTRDKMKQTRQDRRIAIQNNARRWQRQNDKDKGLCTDRGVRKDHKQADRQTRRQVDRQADIQKAHKADNIDETRKGKIKKKKRQDEDKDKTKTKSIALFSCQVSVWHYSLSCLALSSLVLFCLALSRRFASSVAKNDFWKDFYFRVNSHLNHQKWFSCQMDQKKKSFLSKKWYNTGLSTPLKPAEWV